MAEPSRPRHRRPAPLSPGSFDSVADSGLDPAVITQIAQETAAVLLRVGRASDDPAVTQRLVALVEDVGLTTIAELWADRPARSLPGALWRLYVLREWVQRDPVGASRDYTEGIRFADVAGVVAGAASPPGPDEMRDLADAILRGVFDGDVGVALHRAAAFCRVVAAGRASSGAGAEHGESQARRAASVLTMGDDLDACAVLWRRQALD